MPLILVVLSVLLVAVPFSVRSQQNPNAEQLPFELCRKWLEADFADQIEFEIESWMGRYILVSSPSAKDEIELKRIPCDKTFASQPDKSTLTLLHGFDSLQARKPTKGIDNIRTAADAGHPIAQAYLALQLGRGKHLKRDVAAALDYAERAAEQDYRGGHIMLAILHLGLRNERQALRALRRAAAKDSDLARLYLAKKLLTTRGAVSGTLWNQNRAEAIQALRELDTDDNPVGKHFLSRALLLGIPSERAEGIRRLKKEARTTGRIEPALALGKAYEEQGDWERARRWFCFAGSAGEKRSSRPINCDGNYVED